MKKANLFTAKKEMMERVTDFMHCKVWSIVYRKRAEREITEHENAIISNKKLLESAMKEDSILATMKMHEERIEAIKAQLEKDLEDNANFQYTEHDLTFYANYKKAENDSEILTAIDQWFDVYGLDTKDTYLANDILKAISGKSNNSTSGFVKSGATKFVREKRTKGDVLKLFYGTLSEAMLEAGTLKAEAIPEDIREMFAPKKKASKKNNK